jgi:hypothetical protein
MYLGLPLLCHECTAWFDVVELLKLVMRDTRARITAGGEEEKGEGREKDANLPPLIHTCSSLKTPTSSTGQFQSRQSAGRFC